MEEWREAFEPDKMSGWSTEGKWHEFAEQFGTTTNSEEHRLLYKEWDRHTGEVYGYIKTSNAMRINEKLYDPANDGKTDEEIFTRKDRHGELRDLKTVRLLDKKIRQSATPRDAIYTRYASVDAIVSTMRLTRDQARLLNDAIDFRWRLSPLAVRALNKAFKGSSSYSNSYTSTSGNREHNVFSDRPIERRLYIPGGTHAYAARDNPIESEVVFGRRMETKVDHISISDDGHIIFHERFVGYRKK